MCIIFMEQTVNKLSHKKWKCQLRKQKRKLKRQAVAKESFTESQVKEDGLETESCSDEIKDSEEHLSWLQREKEAQELFKAKKEKEEREKVQIENEKCRIREEFEREQLKALEISRKVSDAVQKVSEKRTSPETWHNPEPPKGYNPEPPKGYNAQRTEQEICSFYKKVGSCRFGMKCKRFHEIPSESCIIMIPGMFTCFELENERDYDICLEFEEMDRHEEFLIFYNEVFPEFNKVGRVVKFLVCRNYEPHLRGNVYIEYSSVEGAQEAFRQFNGRWFDKRQLSCQFVNIDSWFSAICGHYLKNECKKGKDCNYLHVFEGPRCINTDQRHTSPRRRSDFRKHSHFGRSPERSVTSSSHKNRGSSRKRSRSKTSSDRSSRHREFKRKKTNSPERYEKTRKRSQSRDRRISSVRDSCETHYLSTPENSKCTENESKRYSRKISESKTPNSHSGSQSKSKRKSKSHKKSKKQKRERSEGRDSKIASTRSYCDNSNMSTPESLKYSEDEIESICLIKSKEKNQSKSPCRGYSPHSKRKKCDRDINSGNRSCSSRELILNETQTVGVRSPRNSNEL